LKWRWWFLRATSIGTRSSASHTPLTSTQHCLSGTAASSDVGSRRTSTSSCHPVAPVGHCRQHLAWRLCCTTVVLKGRTSSCTIPRRVTTDRATPHPEHTHHHGESTFCAGLPSVLRSMSHALPPLPCLRLCCDTSRVAFCPHHRHPPSSSLTPVRVSSISPLCRTLVSPHAAAARPS
jgi:hypothetical protein